MKVDIAPWFRREGGGLPSDLLGNGEELEDLV
jgi:hypothetical protein